MWLSAWVAAAAMAWPTTGSAIPVTWEVWTSRVARSAGVPALVGVGRGVGGEVLADGHHGGVAAGPQAGVRVGGVGQHPVKVLVPPRGRRVAAPDQPTGELATQRHELLVDPYGVVQIHHRRLDPVQPGVGVPGGQQEPSGDDQRDQQQPDQRHRPDPASAVRAFEISWSSKPYVGGRNRSQARANAGEGRGSEVQHAVGTGQQRFDARPVAGRQHDRGVAASGGPGPSCGPARPGRRP